MPPPLVLCGRGPGSPDTLLLSWSCEQSTTSTHPHLTPITLLPWSPAPLLLVTVPMSSMLRGASQGVCSGAPGGWRLAAAVAPAPHTPHPHRPIYHPARGNGQLPWSGPGVRGGTSSQKALGRWEAWKHQGSFGEHRQKTQGQMGYGQEVRRAEQANACLDN